jgi:muconolactone delta-isomerase
MDSTHPAEFLYTLTVKDISPYEGETERGLLNLYQTRSPHWKALEISEADLKLPLWALIAKLPLLYLNNNKLPSITTSNANDSWHNIWQVPGSVSHIAVFYLPQYLEFLGFLLLPLPIIGAIFHLLTQKIKEPRQTRSQKETFPHRD